MERIVLIAYDLNPRIGSECIIAHSWLQILSKYYLVEVFVDEKHKKDIESFNYGNKVNFNYVVLNGIAIELFKRLRFYNLAYLRFVGALKPMLLRKINQDKFSLIHYITPAGIHSYNTLYQSTNLPYIIGSLGGGLKIPKNFYYASGILEGGKNLIREIFYQIFIKNNVSLRKYLLNANRIMIGTEYLFEYLPKETRDKTRIIFDTLVDLEDFRQELTCSKRDCVQIIFVGYLSAIKGILILIEAIRALKVKREDIASKIKVVILGDGPLREKVRRRIIKYELSKIITLEGKVDRKMVIEYLHNSDIFCLPTIRESGGGAILEAMACGLPVITSNYGGPAYSVTDECGIKIEVNNYKQYVHDLSEAIIRLAEDEPLRKQMGMKARERVEQEFSLQAMEKKILGVYNEVLDEIKE